MVKPEGLKQLNLTRIITLRLLDMIMGETPMSMLRVYTHTIR
jgi:hypothetical protein